MNATRFALRNRSVVLVLTGFAVLLGVLSLLTMPRREDPKITIRTGLVLARYPGASAQQVEDQVTRKIEERLFRHQEVRKLKTFSTSRDGVIVVIAQRYRTQERNRQDARERLIALLRQAAVPPVPRRPTRPTKASRERRIEGKKRRGSIKHMRRAKPLMD